MTKDAETGSFQSKSCECGQILYFTNEESKLYFEKLQGGLPEDGRGVFILGPSYLNCPTCGKVHFLPPPEVLDRERQFFFGLHHDWKEDDSPDNDEK